jgi:hypothetical protein
MINPYIGSKNPRNYTKTPNQPETKTFLSSHIFFR